jgi:hypothetical protein
MKEYGETNKQSSMSSFNDFILTNFVASLVVKDADKMIIERGEYFESKCQKENDPTACENAFLFSTMDGNESKMFAAAER